MTDLPLPRRNSTFPRVIHATYAPYQGSMGFTTLVLSTHGGQTELDPHTTGARKITIDDDGAQVLRCTLTGWLR